MKTSAAPRSLSPYAFGGGAAAEKRAHSFALTPPDHVCDAPSRRSSRIANNSLPCYIDTTGGHSCFMQRLNITHLPTTPLPCTSQLRVPVSSHRDRSSHAFSAVCPSAGVECRCGAHWLTCCRYNRPLNSLVSTHLPLTHAHDDDLPATNKALTPSTPGVPNCCSSKGSAPHWSNPPFLIFDIRALWRSVLSARAPECQKLKMVG